MRFAVVAFIAAVLTGCSTTGSAPITAWGKKDVTMIDYRTDAGQCAVLAATNKTSGTNAANTAGGISGQNTSAPQQAASGAATAGAGPAAGGSSSNNLPSQTGGAYRDSASADFVNRAAMQQRTQEMAEQRARNDALKSCLSNRGYTEFALTSEQRAQLSKLQQGSDERREYLYKLGTDPSVLQNQAVSQPAIKSGS